ncbi:uncharacterized protein LOC107758764 [Sinocyclocheilus rhinocerous]|uniref:uncharacterized protein LOC107758764 n=1 Tax=Sinocyclocheilus rhinocerous TaxID=307959 RepID=UPI0007B86507|nr:PREDICTED: uncharacterized protein LOC107758764 [Sinocyclocheilus rhinocerous]
MAEKGTVRLRQKWTPDTQPEPPGSDQHHPLLALKGLRQEVNELKLQVTEFCRELTPAQREKAQNGCKEPSQNGATEGNHQSSGGSNSRWTPSAARKSHQTGLGKRTVSHKVTVKTAYVELTERDTRSKALEGHLHAARAEVQTLTQQLKRSLTWFRKNLNSPTDCAWTQAKITSPAVQAPPSLCTATKGGKGSQSLLLDTSQVSSLKTLKTSAAAEKKIKIQANRNNAASLQAARGEFNVTNELEYACRPQGEQTGKTRNRTSPGKQAQTPSAKSPNLRGGGREPLFTRHQPAATRGWGRDLSRGSLQTHTPCDPTDPNELARDNTSGNLNTAETLRTSKELILQSHQQFKQAIIKEFSDPESEHGLIAADSELHNSESKAGTRRHPALPQCKTLLQKAPSQKRTEPSPWQQTQVPDQPLGKAMEKRHPHPANTTVCPTAVHHNILLHTLHTGAERRLHKDSWTRLLLGYRSC